MPVGWQLQIAQGAFQAVGKGADGCRFSCLPVGQEGLQIVLDDVGVAAAVTEGGLSNHGPRNFGIGSARAEQWQAQFQGGQNDGLELLGRLVKVGV